MVQKEILLPFLFSFLLFSCGFKNHQSTEIAEEEKPIELKLKVKKGQKYWLKMKTITGLEAFEDKTVNGTTTSNYLFDYQVKDVLSNGHVIMEATIKSVNTTITLMDSLNNLDTLYRYDSETGKSYGTMSKGIPNDLKKLVGAKAQTELDTLYKIIETKTSVKSTCMVLNYAVLPGRKIKPGDEWKGKIEERPSGFFNLMELNYHFLWVKDSVAEIRYDGSLFFDALDVDIMGNQNGTIKIDTATGIIRNTYSRQYGHSTVNSAGYPVNFTYNNETYITILPQ